MDTRSTRCARTILKDARLPAHDSSRPPVADARGRDADSGLGLQRSLDKGSTWARVDGFPSRGLGAPAEHTTHAGISFIVADKSAGLVNGRTGVLFAGLADPGPHHLFRSEDGGDTWAPVQPAHGAPTR